MVEVRGDVLNQVRVLDHGYVAVVEYWGSDERIIEAARMSTQKGFEGWGTRHHRKCGYFGLVDELHPQPGCTCGEHGGPAAGDEKLLAYLWRNNHATPFEMAGLIVEVQAPIFVFREWHRHRTQSYNEMSARYAPLPDLNYVPTVARLLFGGGHLTKQAAAVEGAASYDADEAQRTRDNIQIVYALAQETYQAALDAGCPKELARLVLPVGRYSRMRASANLRNWLAFLMLRYDAKAQFEIREYARVVHEVLSGIFPRTLALFDEGRK
jgi:thymidylate synthase (FAD)